MKNDKHSIVENEDMNNEEEFLTEKKQKRTGIRKYCIFASTLVLFGTVAGISLNKNIKIKDDVNIESTSSTNSLVSSNDIENTSNINSQSEQIHVILDLREEKTIYIYTKNTDGKHVEVPKIGIVTYTQNDVLIPKSDKEIIAIQPINPKIIEANNGGCQLSFEKLVLIYDGENIPDASTLFVKENRTNKNGLPIYSSYNGRELYEAYLIENEIIETEQSSKTK